MEEPAQADQKEMMSTVKITWVRHSMRNNTQSKREEGRAELVTWNSWVMMTVDAGRELLEIFVEKILGNILKCERIK